MKWLNYNQSLQLHLVHRGMVSMIHKQLWHGLVDERDDDENRNIVLWKP